MHVTALAFAWRSHDLDLGFSRATTQALALRSVRAWARACLRAYVRAFVRSCVRAFRPCGRRGRRRRRRPPGRSPPPTPPPVCVCVCARARARACVCACVCACVRVCVHGGTTVSLTTVPTPRLAFSHAHVGGTGGPRWARPPPHQAAPAPTSSAADSATPLCNRGVGGCNCGCLFSGFATRRWPSFRLLRKQRHPPRQPPPRGLSRSLSSLLVPRHALAADMHWQQAPPPLRRGGGGEGGSEAGSRSSRPRSPNHMGMGVREHTGHGVAGWVAAGRGAPRRRSWRRRRP